MKGGKMRESQIQRKILQYLKSIENLYYIKTVVTNLSGVPDVIVCYKGQFIAFEIKRPGGKVSKLQEYNMERIREAGGKAYVVFDVDSVKHIIERMRDE